jgi:hypothetical protein
MDVSSALAHALHVRLLHLQVESAPDADHHALHKRKAKLLEYQQFLFGSGM